ncbi:hypothetical protein [Methanoregula sp.]|uniref:hypothetical protein n=1 Tax=Methanoregula sp. TaxID=2052170 RepID=UPI0025DF949C|nr:hypothetical protein [Methanoregula sp.]
MMHTAFQHLQVWIGWCPNHSGIHAQTRDNRTARGAVEMSDPEPPQPGTSKATITVNHWMTGGALAILVATCFVGGNIWWPFFVGAVLIAFLVYWYYSHRKEAQ